MKSAPKRAKAQRRGKDFNATVVTETASNYITPRTEAWLRAEPEPIRLNVFKINDDAILLSGLIAQKHYKYRGAEKRMLTYMLRALADIKRYYKPNADEANRIPPGWVGRVKSHIKGEPTVHEWRMLLKNMRGLSESKSPLSEMPNIGIKTMELVIDIIHDARADT